MATKKTTTTKKPAAKKAAAPKKVKQAEPQHIGLVRHDSWLEPFEGAIRGRHDHAVWKINQLTSITGRRTRNTVASALRVQATGN